MALRNLENQDFPAFLPLQKLTRRKGTTSQTQLRLLFPDYIFVAKVPTAGQCRKINNTWGGTAGAACGRANPVPPRIMEQLFACCNANGIF